MEFHMPLSSISPAPPVFVSDTYRQKLLMLCTGGCDPASNVVAWSLYDGSGAYNFDASDMTDDPTPPYGSVLAAMRDGWRVMQVPVMQTGTTTNNYELGVMPFEWYLEQWVSITGAIDA
jgi:hypothetical protein